MKTLPLNYFAFSTVEGSWQLLKSSESGDVMYSTGVIAKCKNVSEALFLFKSYLPEYEERSKKQKCIKIEEVILENNGKPIINNISIDKNYFLSEMWLSSKEFKRHFKLMYIMDEFNCEEVGEIFAENEEIAISEAKKFIK